MGESLAPGQQVGPYKIESALGIGTLGVSYRARDARGHAVALKLLRSATALTDREKVRIRREVDALAALNNPYLPGVIEFVTFGDDYAIITDYQRAGDLASRLRRGSLPPATALTLMRHLTDALGQAHAAGVVHGGITAANVLRTTVDGRQLPLLADFGSALRSHAWIRPEHAPDVAAYRAPELDAHGRMSTAADVFALGTLLSAMVEHPAPVAIRDLILRATDPRPRRRYRDAGQFHEAVLEAAQSSLEPPAPVPASVLPPITRSDQVQARPHDELAWLLASESGGLSGRAYRPRAKIIGAIIVAALVALVLSVTFSGPKGSIFGGAKHTPPAPVAAASPGYRSVVFTVQQPPGDASVVEVLNGTAWNQVGANTYTLPTSKGGTQACATFRIADETQSPPLLGPEATFCGTSTAPTLTVQRISPDCRYRGSVQVCYSMMASGLQPGTSDTMVLSLGGEALRKTVITVDKSGHATLPDGDYFHFTSASTGKTAYVTYMGLEYSWTVDKRQ